MMQRLVYVIMVLMATFCACAQNVVTPMAPDTVRPPLEVSVLTVDAGRDIYQLEGHTALRLRRPGEYDMVVNWGVFDFNAPNFVYRFTKGDAEYFCVAYPFGMLVQEYTREHRGVTAQIIDMTPAQADRLEVLVRDNLRPENAAYHYNYIGDNCATRPLALIELAMGDTIAAVPSGDFAYGHTGITDSSEGRGAVTFRDEMTCYHANYPWYQFGIDLALGTGVDRHASPRERAFSPLYMHYLLKDATIGGKPLVASEQEILPGTPGGVSEDPTPWYATPMAVSVCLLVLTVALTVSDIRRRRLSRWFDSVLYGIFFLAGCLLTFLIFVSVHEATSPNWLYLWLNPLCIIPAAGIWIKSCRRVVYWYQFCNFALLILLLAGHYFIGQAMNAAFPVLIVCDMTRSFAYIYQYRKTRD